MTIPARGIKPEHLDLSAVKTENMAVAGAGGTIIGSSSTTDTANYFTVVQYNIYVPTPNAFLIVPYTLHVAHSVNAGSIELFIGLQPAGGGSAMTLHWEIDIGVFRVDGGLFPWNEKSGVGIGMLSATFATAGLYTLYMLIKNKTAGTLFWGRGVSTDVIAHLLFGR